MNIRQSQLQELRRRAHVQQQLDTGAAIASNPLSAIFWGIARLFTDDPNKQAAAAQLGVATFVVAAAGAGGAQGRQQQIRSVAPAQPQRPVAAKVRPATPARTDTTPISRTESAPAQQASSTPVPVPTASPTPTTLRLPSVRAPRLSAVQIIERLERHVERQNERLALAIRHGDQQYLQNLGLSNTQIRILMCPTHKLFYATYGNAMERAFARAIRSDAQLSGMLIDARKLSGVVFPVRPGGGRPLRPDFGFISGELQGFIVDLTTPLQAAGKLTKYHDKTIVLTYRTPRF